MNNHPFNPKLYDVVKTNENGIIPKRPRHRKVDADREDISSSDCPACCWDFVYFGYSRAKDDSEKYAGKEAQPIHYQRLNRLKIGILGLMKWDQIEEGDKAEA